MFLYPSILKKNFFKKTDIIMSILDRVMVCNNFDVNTVYPFHIQNQQQVGWLMKSHEVLLLQQWPQWFSFKEEWFPSIILWIPILSNTRI